MTEHLAYFSLKNLLGSPSLWLLSIPKDDDTEGEFVIEGSGGIFEFDVEAPFAAAAAALRLLLLFVFARPKPWRLDK